jgi:FdhE protein
VNNTTAAALPALEELDHLTQQMPELAEAAAFYRAVTPLLRQHRQAANPFQLDHQMALRKLEAGIPLLVDEELPFDFKDARALFLNLCRKMESSQAVSQSSAGNPTLRTRRPKDIFSLWVRAQDGDGNALRVEAARQIRRAAERGDLDLPQVWAMLTSGEWRKLELTASGLKLDPDLLRELTRLSLKPAFQLWASGLQAVVDFDRWGRGYCPVCGCSPSLSEIQGKEAARRLRCGLCGAGWRFPHLQCAFCDNDDYKQLVYLTLEGEEQRYKVQACNVCRGYLKVIKTFDPIPVDSLLVQELATLHLDLIAADYEYNRVTAG